MSEALQPCDLCGKLYGVSRCVQCAMAYEAGVAATVDVYIAVRDSMKDFMAAPGERGLHEEYYNGWVQGLCWAMNRISDAVGRMR